MNNIEKAIEYFEVGKNCIPKNETKEYRTLFIEVADTAIQALREKQEREKGCEYCKKDYYNTPLVLTDDLCLMVYPTGHIQLTYDDFDYSIKIDKCPMCGRKLGEKHE